jgi:putative phosphoribosyl transferase
MYTETGRRDRDPGRTDTRSIHLAQVNLEGELQIPDVATGVVLFAHGSGSSRQSPRNQFVARVIREAGVGTLLFDLLTPDEEAVDLMTHHLRFDIDLLAERLVSAARWVRNELGNPDLKLGFFGSSTGGGAALVAAAKLAAGISAVVSRGGRPDLAGPALTYVLAPTLLIVGGLDHVVIELNRKAYEQLRCEKKLKIVPGATHLFEEPGALEQVANVAADWFQTYLGTNASPRAATGYARS